MSTLDNRVIYCDTDSIMICLDGWCKQEDILEKCSDIQNYANERLTEVCQNLLNVKENKYLSLKQEIIASSGFWLAKKKYALWKINQEGFIPKPGKELEIKGIDVVKSSFPKAMQTLVADILTDILLLKEKDDIDKKLKKFYQDKDTVSVEDIAISTGVKELNKYAIGDGYGKGTPAHIKAAINYNNWLKRNKLDKKYTPIRNGEKIKFVYLKKNEYEYESIAFYPDEMFTKLKKFLEEYIDRDKILKSVLENKMKVFYEALDWKLPNFNENVNTEYF